MIHFILLICLFYNIFNYTQIPGVFNNKTLLTGYITPENNMLIFSTNISGQLGLYKYEMDSNSKLYTKQYKLELEPFPTNSSEPMEDFYLNFNYINYSAINITFFNEKYISSFIYNAGSIYYHISIEELGYNKLAIFYNPRNSSLYNSTINFANIDFKNKKLNFTKTYTIDGISNRANCYCVSTSNNNTVCGIIEYFSIGYLYNDILNYSLVLLKDESPIEKVFVYENIEKNEYFYNGVFKNNFYKLIPLDDDKIFYCSIYSSILRSGIMCGLAQVQNNSTTKILIKGQVIFNKMAAPNYLGRNIFSAIKINNSEIILVCAEFNKYDSRNISRIIISNNNSFIKEYKYLYYDNYATSNLHNYLQLLKNNDDDLIFLIIYKTTAKFRELSYSFCDNNTISLYNGEKTKLYFSITPAFFKGYDNYIVFLDYKKEINSLIYGKEGKLVKNGTIYNENNIYFNLSLKDFDDIKKYGQYNITFRNTLNEKESETCIMTLDFNPCEKGCDICTSSKCYDKNWNLIDRYYAKTKQFIIATSVMIFIIIFALIFSLTIAIYFALKKAQPSNRNNNNNDEDIVPLI